MRIGTPEWSMTASLWIRGILGEYYGLDLRAVQWRTGGLEQPGRQWPSYWPALCQADFTLRPTSIANRGDRQINADITLLYPVKLNFARLVERDHDLVVEAALLHGTQHVAGHQLP